MWAGNCVADLAVSLTAEQAGQAEWTSAELPVPDSPAQASLLLRISPWVARLAKSSLHCPGRRSVWRVLPAEPSLVLPKAGSGP